MDISLSLPRSGFNLATPTHFCSVKSKRNGASDLDSTFLLNFIRDGFPLPICLSSMKITTSISDSIYFRSISLHHDFIHWRNRHHWYKRRSWTTPIKGADKYTRQSGNATPSLSRLRSLIIHSSLWPRTASFDFRSLVLFLVIYQITSSFLAHWRIKS